MKQKKSMLKTCSVFLHDDTVDDVLEWLAEFCELVQTLLNNITGPLVHFVVLICVSTNCCLWMSYILNEKILYTVESAKIRDKKD